MAFLQNEHGQTPTEVVLAALAKVDIHRPGMRRFAEAALTAVNDASNDAVEVADKFKELAEETRELLRQYEEAKAEIDDVETRLRAERSRRQRAETERDQARADHDATAAHIDAVAETQRLRAELAAAWADRDLYADLLDRAEQERDAAIRSRAPLAARLAELRSDTAPEPEPVENAVPGTFADVLEMVTHPLLVLTLDRAVAAGLDEHPQASAWRRRTVDALATAAAYVTAKAAARTVGRQLGPDLADLGAYARRGGPGVQLSAAAIALGESQHVTTDPRYCQARIFSVPVEIDPSGRALMLAHIRIGGVQPPAPRLHYLDDTDRTGRLVIGYLGPHLPSHRTN
jgi:hypothetical protein